jgi:Flp pilus assembly protein TadG
MTLTIQDRGSGVNANSKRESSRWGRFKAALGRRLSAGVRDERGAAAILFGVSMPLLLLVALGTGDIYLASNQRNKLQDALDAAALYAAKSSEQTNAGIQTVGLKALNANLSPLPTGVSLVSATFTLVGTKVVAHAESTAPALAAGLWPHPTVTADAEVQRAMDKLEIALVLDNTGSMQDNSKLTTLQTSAKSLVDKLAAAAGRSSDPNAIKIALVPFSNTVRALDTVDLSSYSTTNPTATVPAWIDPKAQAQWDAKGNNTQYAFDAVTDRLLMMKQMGVKWAGCVESRMQPYDIKEDSASSGTKASMFVPYFWPDEPDSNSYNNYKTDGGVSTLTARQKQQRAAKYTGSAPTGTFAMDSSAYGTPYNLGPNAGCTLQPLIRLTTNMQTIKDGIDAMKAMGETDIPIGMVWGWHALSPTGVGPFGDGAAYNTLHLRKIIILMTDGENTMNDPSKSNESNGSFYGGYGYIWQNMLGIASGSSSARTTAIDNRLSALCTNVKAKNITVYTVRVEVTTGTSTLLSNCATTPDKFYDVKNVSQLGAAFDAIAGSIDNLRLSK